MALALVATSPTLEAQSLKPSKYARVYSGGEGLTVTLVPLMPNPAKEALIEVTGTTSAIDSVVLRYEAVGEERLSWSTKLAGENFWTVRNEKEWGTNRLYLALPERPMNPIALSFNENASKSVNASRLIKKHQTQLGNGTITKLVAWNRKEREAQNNEAFYEGVTSMNKACKTEIRASIDWSTVNDELLKKLNVSAYCSPEIHAVESACEDPTRRASIVRSVKTFTCKLTDSELRVRLEPDGTLVWKTNENAANMDDFAKAFVTNQF